MPHYAFILQYNGADFSGWQSQRDGSGIQDAFEKALNKITGFSGRVKAAGRTDAGAHALAQVASANIETSYLPNELIFRLNAVLPKTIAVVGIKEVPKSFHPRKEALRKTYVYLIRNTLIRDPFLDPYVWFVKPILRAEQLKEIAQLFVGTHNFAAFQNTGSKVATTTRTIFNFEIEKTDDLFILTVTANGFLKQMVRNIVGTTMEILRGRFDKKEIEDRFKSGKKHHPNITAPANALFLQNVSYPTWQSGEEQAVFLKKLYPVKKNLFT